MDGGLGFRDIEVFNIALLGKQLWRLLTQKNSLLEKAYKARYYQHSNPLEAKLGSRPSYAWMSLCAAQQLIRRGARVVLGNGKETSIWEDPWLGSNLARPLTRTQKATSDNAHLISRLDKVSDLLLPNGRDWNTELLEGIALGEDRKSIEELRIRGPTTLDNYCWDFARSRHYSVKSGYWVLVNAMGNNQNQGVMQEPSLKPLYQLIWKADTSPKIQHFLWRVIRDCIPVAENLRRRRVIRDGECKRCQAGKESVNHLLFQCPFARLVWEISPIPAPPQGEWSNSIFDNFFRVMTKMPKYPHENEAGKLAPWLLWRIWKSRNDYMIKDIEYDAMDIYLKAKEDMEEWSKYVTEGDKKVVKNQQETRAEGWKPPPTDWYKCNIDGAWTEQSSHCGIGWILRDSSGKAVWMGGRKLPRLESPLETEAEALRWAVQIMRNFNYRKIIFESDSKAVDQALHEENSWPVIQGTTQDILQMLGQEDHFKVAFHSREGNKMADRIAQSKSFLNNDPRLYSIMPNWIQYVVETEKQSCNMLD